MNWILEDAYFKQRGRKKEMPREIVGNTWKSLGGQQNHKMPLSRKVQRGKKRAMIHKTKGTESSRRKIWSLAVSTAGRSCKAAALLWLSAVDVLSLLFALCLWAPRLRVLVLFLASLASDFQIVCHTHVSLLGTRGIRKYQDMISTFFFFLHLLCERNPVYLGTAGWSRSRIQIHSWCSHSQYVKILVGWNPMSSCRF